MVEFVFVKSVNGRLVPRYSTLQSSSTTYIGASRDGRKLVWTEDAVVRIPLPEWTRYLKEYERALREGSLKKASAADFAAWEKKRADADAKVEAGIKDAAKKEADELKKATEEAAAKEAAEAKAASAGDKKKSQTSSKDEGEKE
jgi:hypothetical protein